MSEVLKTQRESYVQQLQQVEQSIKGLEVQRERFGAQREQLKGAIFALDSLAQAQEPAVEMDETEIANQAQKG